MNWLQDKKLN